MAKLEEIQIVNFQEYLDAVDKGQNNDSSLLWFRGVGKSSYKLCPSIHRHKDINNSGALFAVERKLLTRFKERSVPYLSHRLEDSWELLFLMQHYGMPTRLLDWSENPFTALFFALSSARKNDTGDYDTDAAVWVLSPSKWNQTVFKHQSYVGGALSPSDTMVNNSYSVETDSRLINEYPVAILGIHNSPRIVAQRGTFCLFGKSLDPMEFVFENNSFLDDSLRKLVIPSGIIRSLLEKLVWMGITDSVVYPDLEGLARETKRQFGYEI